eukprot:COSAG03_NODE_7813_length_870_cov_1.403372_2_plen_78_part_01
MLLAVRACATVRLAAVPDCMGFWTTLDPLCVARFSGDPGVPLRIATLILEMLAEPRGQRLPEELRASACYALWFVHGI